MVSTLLNWRRMALLWNGNDPSSSTNWDSDCWLMGTSPGSHTQRSLMCTVHSHAGDTNCYQSTFKSFGKRTAVCANTGRFSISSWAVMWLHTWRRVRMDGSRLDGYSHRQTNGSIRRIFNKFRLLVISCGCYKCCVKNMVMLQYSASGFLLAFLTGHCCGQNSHKSDGAWIIYTSFYYLLWPCI